MNGKTERDRWHATKALWRFGAAAVLGSALLAALVNGSTPASANTVYDWQGICTLGCTGTASGVLTLTNGASPYSFSASEFVSFQFISSSGTFFLDNASPYLAAQGGVSNPEGPFIFLEENAFGPNTLPLWQLVSYESAVLPITLSPEPGGWQF